MPTNEVNKIKNEAQASNRMAKILKKMHSPRNFATPNQFSSSVMNVSSADVGYASMRKNKISIADSLIDDHTTSMTQALRDRSMMQLSTQSGYK